MNKEQLIYNITQTTEASERNLKNVLRGSRCMVETGDALLVNAICSAGAGIIDALNNIALALSETLPKEGEP